MKNWKDTLISPSTPIRIAIQHIDEGALQIALVVDKKRSLLGTVTDGDVRRAILRGASLNGPVHGIMQAKPVTASVRDSKENILFLMKQKGIRQIPLVDGRGRIAGIEVIDKLVQSGTRDNWVLLMAGGIGRRLQPLTNDCPKPLLNVGKKPILETILENFTEHGFRKFYLSVNYKDEMVRHYFGDGSKWNAEIRYIKENQKLGTAGALGLLPEKTKDFIIVMNGDLLTKINFHQLSHFHHENRADATMCVREYDFQVPYGVVKIENHHIRSIDEKPVHRFFVNAGIYVLEPKVLKLVKKNKPYDMTQLFEKLIHRKFSVTAFPVREYWIDIGRIDDLERANGEFATLFR